MYRDPVKLCIILHASLVYGMSIVEPGPKYPPTKGEVWPKPQQEKKDDIYFSLSLGTLRITTTKNTCDLLKKALERYAYILRNELGLASRRDRGGWRMRLDVAEVVDPNYLGPLQQLKIDLDSPCEDYPYFGMDESYKLTVTHVSTLKSDSIWGILRGLETFSQLFYLSRNQTEILINGTIIEDFPRYPHRGLLVDTSRHFISPEKLLQTLDAMATNKMNVLHWHIVDDQSFPYQSISFPELSEYGAYDPSMVYSKATIQQIVEYARERGIRVIPEFDVPGHTRSWGESHPEILTKCYEDGNVVGLGPMNPINNLTYDLIRELFKEIHEYFPDKYFHVGGDEVDLDCWASNPDLLEYMVQNNVNSIRALHALFMSRAIPMLGTGYTPIVWQEVFDENVPISKNTLVQVWKGSWVREINSIISAGHRVLFSSSYYLDSLSGGGDWEKYYAAVDPAHMLQNASFESMIAGGEACMWGEVVDDTNIISRVWPRASAVAERLWISDSPQPPTANEMNIVRRRLEEHTCRMNRRGIGAQPPNGPGFCVGRKIAN